MLRQIKDAELYSEFPKGMEGNFELLKIWYKEDNKIKFYSRVGNTHVLECGLHFAIFFLCCFVLSTA